MAKKKPEPKFNIITDSGVLVDNMKGEGYTKKQADTSINKRNKQAEEMDIEARYEMAPMKNSK